MARSRETARKLDRRQAEQMACKLAKGKGFDLEDLRGQLQQMLEMGGVSKMLEQLPGAAQIPAAAKSQVNDRDLKRQIAIINSMTPRERRFPDLIRATRKRRIASGSGTQVQDVNRLLRQHDYSPKQPWHKRPAHHLRQTALVPHFVKSRGRIRPQHGRQQRALQSR